MRPVPLTNYTRRLGAPQGWDHGKQGICNTLEIRDQDGWMMSAWRPSEKEIKRLIDGEPIFLCIQGTGHPVVSLLVGDSKQGTANDVASERTG